MTAFSPSGEPREKDPSRGRFTSSKYNIPSVLATSTLLGGEERGRNHRFKLQDKVSSFLDTFPRSGSINNNPSGGLEKQAEGTVVAKESRSTETQEYRNPLEII